MKVEQFVMAYKVDQDRLRAMMPEGFESLRPVLRINAEIWGGPGKQAGYVEFNTPVAGHGSRGWLNIGLWNSAETDIAYEKNGETTTIKTPFLTIAYTPSGTEGGCPAEKDNDGCFFLGETAELRAPQQITANKEFCGCEFAWSFNENDAHGKSTGKTLPAFPEDKKETYEHKEMTAENAAAIACEQVLGAYIVRFER